MPKKISVITPCYNEELGIRECYETIKGIFDEHLADYEREHIFCDDGSTDRTVEILKEIAREDSSIKIIVNSRNFGVFANNFNGVINSTGDAVFLLMPADLQDPPELMPQFVEKWENGHEIVYGIRAERDEPFPLRTMRKVYYRIISRFSNIDYPPDVGDYQLVDRRVIDQLRGFRDPEPFMRTMTFEMGYRKTGIPYTWRERKHGVSKNRAYKMIDQGFAGIVSTTKVPIRLATLLGFILGFFSIAFALFNVILFLLNPESFESGIPTVIVALFFFSGINLFFLGIVGEYTATIWSQIRGRPVVVEQERINF